MTLNVPSFFAGIATVVVLLTLGFGGGVMMSGALSDKPREPSKVEKWAAEAQKPPATETQKAPVITATPVPVAPAPAPVAATPAASTPANEQPAPPPSPEPAPQPAPVSTATSSPPPGAAPAA